MKKFLLLSISLLLIAQSSFASHVFGGTIYWRCLNNGQYQFFMEVYRDCTGIPWAYSEEIITIVGNRLPNGASGNPFDKIVLKPDSAKWLNFNFGDMSPSCTDQYGSSNSCDNGDQGAVQQFFYKSNPLTMKGVPPTKGWKFYWESACCRPGDVKNVQTTGTMLLRAAMYPTVNSESIDSCFYSSPQFISPPTTTICRGENAYNNIGIQRENDSISFSWDRAYNPPYANPDPLIYKPGYSPSDPTPDDTIDSRNKPSMLDPITGNIELAVYSGTTTEKFINVVQIDSWRDGKIVATTYRELPLAIGTCPTLPYDSLAKNQKPDVFFNNKKQRNLSLTYQAGANISIPIQLIDNDTTGIGTNFQSVSFKPYGQLYSSDFTDTMACDFPPCAILKNTTPAYDSSELGYTIQAQQRVNTTFEWQTNCSHLDRNGKSKTYLFYYKAQDDHCPFPESISGVLKITLVEKNNTSKPSMQFINGDTLERELSWKAQNVIQSSFQQWYIYGSATENGSYSLIDSVGDYNLRIYVDSITKNKYYFVKAKNLLCNSTNRTTLSQASDTIQLDNSSLALTNVSSFIQLSWEESRSSYREDETRKYSIYRSYPIGTAFELLDSVFNSSTYNDSIIICDDSIAYMVKGDSSFATRYYFQDSTGINSPRVEWTEPILVQNDTLFAAYDLADYQWYDCELKQLIENETNKFFVPRDTGFYTVAITKSGCKDTSACIPFFPVGLSEVAFQEQVSFYPNPTNGMVQINLEELANEVTIQVLNLQGQLMQEERFNDQSFQLELPTAAGIYFIQLTNQSGERANLKVVKQ